MAPPIPLGMRTRFEFAPPRNTVEAAFENASATLVGGAAHAPPAMEGRSNVAFLYLTEQGAILRKAGDRFLVEKDDEVVLDLPCHKLKNVLLFGFE